MYVLKDTFFTHSIADEVQRVLKELSCDNIGEDEIFISRSKKNKRTISNLSEIENIVRERGFRIIEPGDLTLVEQIKTFSRARFVIGIHGAGLTNIIFRNKHPLSVFELFPGNGWAPEHYENICIQFGYRYSSLDGEDYTPGSNFYIKPDEFLRSLNRFLIK